MGARWHTLRKALRAPASEWAAEALRLHRQHQVSLRAYPHARAARLHLIPPWVDLRAGQIVDLGANVGEWTSHVVQALPRAHVVAVEPVPSLYQQLAANLSHHPNVTTEMSAVAGQSGRMSFYVTEGPVFGSLLRPTAEGVAAYADAPRVTEMIEVRTTTLDQLTGGRPTSLLKLDVQGAELQVLAGGSRALMRTQSIIAEMNFVSLYENSSTLASLHEALIARGFFLWDMAEPGRLSNGRLSYADVCYARFAEAPRDDIDAFGQTGCNLRCAE
jgi:FkbM family methyltransferase